MADTRPTIAHVLHRLDRAGAEVLAADLARKLAGEFRFVFLCLDGVGELGEQLRGEGYDVICLDRRPGVDPATAWRLRRTARRHRVDMLHAHQYTPFFYSALSRIGAAHPPIIFTEHGRHYPDARRLKRVWANRLLLRRHDRVTAVGRFVRQALIDHEGLDERRLNRPIDVIYNGIEVQRFDGASRTQVRRELGYSEGDLLVMQVARFHPVKDHATAVRAFATAASHVPRAKLVLIGDGLQRRDIEALVHECGIADRVRFLGVRDDVHRLLAAADLFMLSSLSEGVSVTLLEAMAARLPIAATDVGGNGEVVVHGETGLLSPRRNVEALAQNLTRVLYDGELRSCMGQAGRRRVEQQFSQRRMHDAYRRVYGELTRASRQSGPGLSPVNKLGATAETAVPP